MMRTGQTLGKSERLKSRKQIEQLFAAGQRLNMHPFRVSYTVYPFVDGENLLFGVGAGTRNFKRATDRNRIKRLSREAWRLQNAELKEVLHQHSLALHVFLIYTGKELPGYAEVSPKVKLIIDRLTELAVKHGKQSP